MAKQDEFYFQKESNAFFDRWKKTNSQLETIRESKKEIHNQITSNYSIDGKRVLEIGCFIGDLLGYFQSENKCEIYGIEASTKACDYALNNFNVKIENAAFSKSSLFSLTQENHQKFDVIICDDVLSWMDRDIILPTLGVIDWILKPGGALFFRDFSPAFNFAYENHHWPGQNIYNYKQAGGHRQFFLSSGKYYEKHSFVRNDVKYQLVNTSRPDSATWSDSILIKSNESMHPKIKM